MSKWYAIKKDGAYVSAGHFAKPNEDFDPVLGFSVEEYDEPQQGIRDALKDSGRDAQLEDDVRFLKGDLSEVSDTVLLRRIARYLKRKLR